ncbi:MAG: response regulator [Candidatus Berkiella sp.]
MATVLIVDDRAINREYLESLLNYLNLESMHAQNGQEALDAVQKKCPDLIISDILMPVMDGYTFIRQLKQSGFTDIPIIMYTATYRKEEAELLADDLGVQHVLSKPADPQLLVETIQKALGIPNASQAVCETVAQNQDDLKINLYQAPQQLIISGGKLLQATEQLQRIKEMLQKTPASHEKSSLISLADDLADDIQNYRKTNSDLFLLIELTLEMIAEKDVEKLIQLFCDGTRKAVDAEFGLTCILDSEGKIRHVMTSGFTDVGFAQNAFNLSSTFVQEVLQKRSAFAINEVTPQTLTWHTTAPSGILCTAVFTANQVYGFSYFINKKNDVPFKEEEIRILDTLVSVLAIFYENMELYTLIQQQAAKLQIESSKLKIAKDELHKSEVMFRQFAENIEDVFWRTSSTLDKIIYISPGYETIWGKSTASIYQDPCSWQELIVEEDKSKVNSFIKKIIENEEGASLEYRIKHPDGMIRNIYNKTICLKDESGKLDHIIGIASDVTEYLQNQKEIKLENELAELLEKDVSLMQVAPQILQLVCKVFEWQIGEMWLTDDERNVLQNIGIWHKKRKSYGAFALATSNTTLKIEEDSPGIVWQKREPKRFANYSSHASFKRSALMYELDLHDAAGLPLLYQDKVLGVMHFFAKKITTFDENFNRILMMLGSRVSEYIYQKMTQEQLLQLVRRGSYRVIF